jgi:anti-sigma factor RsiW
MTCQEIADFLAAYLGGELAAATRAAFEAHLKICVECVNYLDSYKKTIALGKLAFAPGADAAARDAVPEKLVRAILEARKAK